VARIAADFFGIAFDDRQRIVIQDARAYLDRPTLESSYDTIIMDAFSDSSNNLDHLATVEFYQACRSRMARGGVLCVNMLKSDPQLLAKLKTFQRCFRSVVASERKRSLVLFGTDQHKLPQHALLQRAQVLHKQHDFTFSLPEHAATLEPLRELHWARSDAFREAAVLRDAGIADE
jgi:spermidine synthase